MIDLRKQPNQVRDYKERFEFKLTVGDNIICQRYFKINNFNKDSLRSQELVDVINNCVSIIDNELKSKTADYLEIFAPMYFNSVEEMNSYFADEANKKRMRIGHGICVKGSEFDYAWGKDETPHLLNFKFDDGELSAPLTNDDRVTYKFAFFVDGRETCARIWEGVYPRYIRNSIDLSNKKGRQLDEDVSRLNFEQYLDYRIVNGRTDLVWGLIKDICTVCSFPESSDYTLTDVYGDKEYKNKQSYSELFKIYGLSYDGMTKVNKRNRK